MIVAMVFICAVGHALISTNVKVRDVRKQKISPLYWTDSPDIPCQGAAHNCSAFADCHNDHGLYYCTCWDGYFSPLGDGVTCENINECEKGLHGCPTKSECVDNDGSFVCQCLTGYAKFTEDGTNS